MVESVNTVENVFWEVMWPDLYSRGWTPQSMGSGNMFIPTSAKASAAYHDLCASAIFPAFYAVPKHVWHLMFDHSCSGLGHSAVNRLESLDLLVSKFFGIVEVILHE